MSTSDTGAQGRTLAERLLDLRSRVYECDSALDLTRAGLQLGDLTLLREAAAALSSSPRADVEALWERVDALRLPPEGGYSRPFRVGYNNALDAVLALASPAPSALRPETAERLALCAANARGYEAGLRDASAAPVVAQEPVRGARDALHCAISLAVAAGREDTAEVLRALYAGAAPAPQQPRNELEAYVNALEAAAHTKEVGKQPEEGEGDGYAFSAGAL